MEKACHGTPQSRTAPANGEAPEGEGEISTNPTGRKASKTATELCLAEEKVQSPGPARNVSAMLLL
jgi:hypothetical protein